MSHTPGPWSGITNSHYGDTTILDAEGEQIVAGAIDNEDNARLIAAAPDLLEALKAAAQIIGHPDDSFSKLMAQVIAKAEGK